MASLAGFESAPEGERPCLLLDTHPTGRYVALQTERAKSAIWERGAGLRAIADFLARGGDSGRLITVTLRVVARSGRILICLVSCSCPNCSCGGESACRRPKTIHIALCAS